jgi:hypothetical protein
LKLNFSSDFVAGGAVFDLSAELAVSKLAGTAGAAAACPGESFVDDGDGASLPQPASVRIIPIATVRQMRAFRAVN